MKQRKRENEIEGRDGWKKKQINKKKKKEMKEVKKELI